MSKSEDRATFEALLRSNALNPTARFTSSFAGVDEIVLTWTAHRNGESLYQITLLNHDKKRVPTPEELATYKATNGIFLDVPQKSAICFVVKYAIQQLWWPKSP